MPRDLEVPLDVLYIEDHPTNVQLMQAIFRHCGDLHLVVARSGREALEIAAQIQPVLLLVDMRLPDCDGAGLLKSLRTRYPWTEVPAVAVTAEASVNASDAGFCELWHKPLDLTLVLSRLKALTDRAPSSFSTQRRAQATGVHTN